MDIAKVSASEIKQLSRTQEHYELEEIRSTVRLRSLADAQARFEQVESNCDMTLHVAEEAYVNLAEDDLDSWEQAKEKCDKIDRIEAEHDRWISIWENQRRRLNWEARQAQRAL